ncbi:MAG: serine hydrolase [Bacteroidetes bacterium]|nr:serine hydrolase [Bacteroidota bacterium]
MKKYAIVLLAIFTISCAFGQVDKRLKGIEKEFNKILKATKAPGFAVAIVEGDKVIYSKGFGYRDYENEIPMDANTLLAIGSSSKAFTCSILGQLRQEEKISFNDSPIKYIPELRFYNEDLNSRIIIQDLMSHQTGIPRHDFSWYLFPTYSKDSLIQRIQYHEPFTGLRQQWHYNNFMFLTLGVIAERITGKSWEDNIRERFFQPLGMKRSNVSIEELEKSSNAAVGYELKKDSIISKMDYYRIAGMSPAGSINSSVNEMSNWLITWINKGKFKGEQILPEYYVTEAMSSQAVINASLPRKDFPDLHLANYGYGWVISSYRGHYRVEHSGGIDGFSANVAFYPSDSIGIVVLTNQNGSAVPSFVRNTVADRMLGTKRTDWAQEFISRQKKNKEAKVESSSSKVSDTHPSHELQAYTGNYSHSGYGQFEITNQLDSMFANFKLKKYYLKHVHYDVFEPFEVSKTGIDTTDTGPLRFNFITSDAGEIASVRMKIEGALDHPIEFDHEPNEIDVDLATLEKYTGEYDLSGTEIKIYIKNENTLYLFVAGQPEYEVIPTDKHIFTFKTLDGFKVEFKESDDKSINQLILRQPNGTFKATRK